MKKTLSILLALLLFMGVCAGCAASPAEEAVITSPAELNNSRYTVGFSVGTASAADAEEYFTQAVLAPYTDGTDGYVAVEHGKLDGFVFSRVNMEYAIASGGLRNVHLLEESIGGKTEIVVGVSRLSEIPELRERLNSFIRTIHADGSFDEIYERWIVRGEKEMPEIPEPEEPDFTIRIGTCGQIEPFAYYYEDSIIGLDIELALRFAASINAKVEFFAALFTPLIAAAESGSIDCIFANLNATPERAEVMDFSDPIYTLDTAVMVRGEDPAAVPLASYDGKKLGVITGSIHEQLTSEALPNAEICYYTGLGEQVAALSSHVIDGFLLSSSSVDALFAENSGFVALREPVGSVDCAFAIRKAPENYALCAEINEYLQKLRADGSLAARLTKWNSGTVSEAPDASDLPRSGKTLRFATSGELFPFTYYIGDRLAGYEVELFIDFCREYGYALDIEQVSFSSLIAGLVSGSYDIAANSIIITPERAETVLFSEPNRSETMVLIVCPEGKVSTGSFGERIAASFEKTFIREGRWKMILRGLGVTVFISVLSAVFGTVLGFGICLLRRRRGILFGVTTVYIRIMQGTPLLVLLMVLYYLVFPQSGISGEWVAIIGFSLHFAAYVSEIMRSGIESIDRGQTEAALALGFTKRQAFLRFVFPQAARLFLPVYKGEFISMMKMTSVVGYIAVQDLTKISDIIRSRTYEAFFPLISTALIYFLLSAVLSALLRRVELRLEPKRKDRCVKGVKLS